MRTLWEEKLVQLQNHFFNYNSILLDYGKYVKCSHMRTCKILVIFSASFYYTFIIDGFSFDTIIFRFNYYILLILFGRCTTNGTY